MMYGLGSTPGSCPTRPAMPVPSRTVDSQRSICRLKPCSKSVNVIGPGAMKKTKIQIGQWFSRYETLFRARMTRSDARSMRRAWPSVSSYEGGRIDLGNTDGTLYHGTFRLWRPFKHTGE